MPGVVEKRRGGADNGYSTVGVREKPRINGGKPATMVRIQLDLPEEKVEELNEVMAKADIGTRKDLFNNALSLLAWAIKEREAGNIIAAMNESAGTYKELVMPSLDAAAKKKQYADRERAPDAAAMRGQPKE